jgi:hypothetical protein
LSILPLRNSCAPPREMFLGLCAVEAHDPISCRFFTTYTRTSTRTSTHTSPCCPALRRPILTGGSSRLAVQLRRLCSIKPLHRVPGLAAVHANHTAPLRRGPPTMHASDPRQPSTWLLADSHPAYRAKSFCHLGLCPHASTGAIARLSATNFPGLVV